MTSIISRHYGAEGHVSISTMSQYRHNGWVHNIATMAWATDGGRRGTMPALKKSQLWQICFLVFSAQTAMTSGASLILAATNQIQMLGLQSVVPPLPPGCFSPLLGLAPWGPFSPAPPICVGSATGLSSWDCGGAAFLLPASNFNIVVCGCVLLFLNRYYC